MYAIDTYRQGLINRAVAYVVLMEQLRGSCWNYDARAANPSRRLSPTRSASLGGGKRDAADWLPTLLPFFH